MELRNSGTNARCVDFNAGTLARRPHGPSRRLGRVPQLSIQDGTTAALPRGCYEALKTAPGSALPETNIPW